jgi:hypothetical protein
VRALFPVDQIDVFAAQHFADLEATKTMMQRWARIQKPAVTYDMGMSSVTNCARLPNYFKVYVFI